MTMQPVYETASIHELFDLLEEAVESYTLARSHLANNLRESAEKEIAFYLSLLKERLNGLLESTRLYPQLQLALMELAKG